MTDVIIILFSFSVIVVQLLSHVQLCDTVDCSLSGSSVRGIFQARMLEWIATSYLLSFMFSI